MDQYSLRDSKLESQVRECFGRVAYTHKAHEKCADRLTEKSSCLKIMQIILSVVTTGGFFYTVFGDSKLVTVIGVVSSCVLLALILYTKEFNIEAIVEKHRASALRLWDVRESYISLIVDLDELGYEDVMSRRDLLQKQLLEIYMQAPRTNSKGFLMAQNALKHNEELTFTDEEIDVMLPQKIRKNNSNRK